MKAYVKFGGTTMKKALCATWRLYKEHFGPLMLALLVQLILRGIALTPLMFLADKALAPLAWLAVPAYLFIVLPARQNMALAIRDLLAGGSVFTVRLIETDGYGKKLLRGLKGMLYMLLWSAVTIAGVAWLVLMYKGVGNMDGFSLLGVFANVGQIVGGKTIEGALLIIGCIAATGVLGMTGCALHCGDRHVQCRKDLKGMRGGLIGLWFTGFVLVTPFLLAVALTMGGWAMGALREFLNTLTFSALAIQASQVWKLALSTIVLLPVIPFRTLLPAVYLHDKEAA